MGQSITVGYTGGSSYYYTYVRDVAVADFNDDGRDDVVWATCNRYTYNYDYNQYGRVMVYYQTTSGLPDRVSECSSVRIGSNGTATETSSIELFNSISHRASRISS